MKKLLACIVMLAASAALVYAQPGSPYLSYGKRYGAAGFTKLTLPGASGSYASTPSAAANQITGNIQLDWAGDITTLPPASGAGLVGKWQGTGSNSYYLYVSSTDTLCFAFTDGTSTFQQACSVATLSGAGYTSGSSFAVRLTYNGTTDTATWTTAPSFGGTYTAFDSKNTGCTTPCSILSTTGDVEIGGNTNGTADFYAGHTTRVQIRNGIGGTLAVDMNPADPGGTSTSWTSAATGEAWTAHGTAARQ